MAIIKNLTTLDCHIARKFHNKLLTMLHHGWAGGSSMAILK